MKILISNLSPHHKQMLEQESAISPDVIEKRGYRTVTGAEVRQYGFTGQQARDGLLLPVITTDNKNGLYVLRPDSPRVFEDKRKRKDPLTGDRPQKVVKYEWPKNTPPRVDVPPPCVAQLKDATIPLWITEGQKKGDALASKGLCAIDLPNGVWGWKSKQDGFLADFDHIAWQGRKVYIVFDSDVTTKPSVAKAMGRLTIHLSRRGADVSPVPLPQSDDKLGVDDFFAQGGTIEQLMSFAALGEALPLQTDGRAVVGPKSGEYIEVLQSLGYSFRMNATNDRIEVNEQPMTNALRAVIRTQMRDAGYSRQLDAIEDAIGAWAYTKQYHPVKEYLESLEYDGQPHIANLAAFFSDVDAKFGRWLKAWLTGAVAKVYEPAQNYMLVLDGAQGIGKSHFAAWLGSALPDYFIESPVNPDDKDNSIRLMSKWIWEVSELGSSFRRSDRDALKFFITQKNVTVRQPYGRYDVTKPALASLIGTINNEAGFLTDPTGNRRFLVCELTRIDWNYTQVDVSQIWAEAYHEYRAGYPYWLDRQEQTRQHEINTRYRVDSPVLDLFLKYYDVVTDSTDPRYQWIATADIMQKLGDFGMRGSAKSNQMELAAALKAMGVTKAKKSNVNGYYGVFERVMP